MIIDFVLQEYKISLKCNEFNIMNLKYIPNLICTLKYSDLNQVFKCIQVLRKKNKKTLKFHIDFLFRIFVTQQIVK